jgi:hypothetical protein
MAKHPGPCTESHSGSRFIVLFRSATTIRIGGARIKVTKVSNEDAVTVAIEATRCGTFVVFALGSGGARFAAEHERYAIPRTLIAPGATFESN